MKFLSFLIFLSIISCGVIPGKTIPMVGSSPIELGSIGIMRTDEFTKQFSLAAIPVLTNKIRIIVEETSFDKNSAKKFNKLQFNKNQLISLEDTVVSQTSFLRLKIGDKVTWLAEINGKDNSETVNYLKAVSNPVIVSSISISFPPETHKEIIKAQEIYLVNNDKKQYLLELFSNQKLVNTIDLTKGCVFDFDTNGFCWAENEKHEIGLVDINENGCHKPAYNSFDKAEKKKEEFKF